MRGSLSLERPVEKLNRLNPAVNSLQGTKSAPLNVPVVSPERLIPLANYLAAREKLPNISQWVVRKIRKGYRSRPPKFNGILNTVVGPEQAHIMEQEVRSLLAIDIIPPP